LQFCKSFLIQLIARQVPTNESVKGILKAKGELKSPVFKEKMIKSTGRKVNFNESTSDQMAELVVVLERKLNTLSGRVQSLENKLLEKGSGLAGVFSTPATKFQVATIRRDYEDYSPRPVSLNTAEKPENSESSGNWIQDWFQLANLDTTS